MSRRVLGVVVLFTSVAPGPAGADEPRPVPAEKLEPFRGRWATTRETRDGDKVRRHQLVLDFKGGELTFVTEEDGKKGNAFTLKVLAVESGDGSPHLVLGHGERSRYTVHYDFEAGRLILVGRLLNRPFENFSLSGEYRRVEAPK